MAFKIKRVFQLSFGNSNNLRSKIICEQILTFHKLAEGLLYFVQEQEHLYVVQH